MTLCHTISSCSDSSDGETAANGQEPGQEQTLRARVQVLESELHELRVLRNEHGDLLELVRAKIKQNKEFKEAFKAKAGSRGHFSAMLSQKTSLDSVVTVTPASMEPVVSTEFKRAKVLQAITEIGSVFKSNGPYTQSHRPRVKQANAPVGQGASTQADFVSFYTFKNLDQETPAKIFSSNTSTTLTNPEVAVETLKLKSKEFMECSTPTSASASASASSSVPHATAPESRIAGSNEPHRNMDEEAFGNSFDKHHDKSKIVAPRASAKPPAKKSFKYKTVWYDWDPATAITDQVISGFCLSLAENKPGNHAEWMTQLSTVQQAFNSGTLKFLDMHHLQKYKGALMQSMIRLSYLGQRELTVVGLEKIFLPSLVKLLATATVSSFSVHAAELLQRDPFVKFRQPQDTDVEHVHCMASALTTASSPAILQLLVSLLLKDTAVMDDHAVAFVANVLTDLGLTSHEDRSEKEKSTTHDDCVHIMLASWFDGTRDTEKSIFVAIRTITDAIMSLNFAGYKLFLTVGV
ncbi:hypothetical protein HDU80_000465 [Chytriomyces hyalinus]|nr:hypothetical protein HDU80_000465 [Chytriomyces hyalinus]